MASETEHSIFKPETWLDWAVTPVEPDKDNPSGPLFSNAPHGPWLEEMLGNLIPNIRIPNRMAYLEKRAEARMRFFGLN